MSKPNEITVDQIVKLLNRRVATITAANERGSASLVDEGKPSELQNILGRITAHRMNIRDIGWRQD